MLRGSTGHNVGTDDSCCVTDTLSGKTFGKLPRSLIDDSVDDSVDSCRKAILLIDFGESRSSRIGLTS